ncbi:hypothetical protein PIB30_069772 [Stylosanthes scabra]|uniref:Uncharacterized protein n=1 Tax=Stylosanthes scabra TaxID=79078 RepID=A0ABU6YLF9_9FABA|nr:hypothetical protein [Stylosanthes scabra]
MTHTRSSPLAKGKTKVYRPPTRASPRLASLSSQGTVSSTSGPSRKHSHVNPPAKKKTPDLSNSRGRHLQGRYEGSCKRSQRIAALHRAKNEASEEHEVIALSNDSEHEKDKNLEVGAEKALLAAEAMLDAESENEAEEIPGQWDLDGVLNNWGTIEPNMGPARNDQGPPPTAN